MKGYKNRCVQGVSNDVLESELKDSLSAQERANAINSLLRVGRLQIFSSKDGLVYKEIDQEEASRYICLLDGFVLPCSQGYQGQEVVQ